MQIGLSTGVTGLRLIGSVSEQADAQDLHIEDLRRDFTDWVSAFVKATLRQVYVQSDQNGPISGRSDLKRRKELRSHMGRIVETGSVRVRMIAVQTVSLSCSSSIECCRTRSLLLFAMLHAWQNAVRLGLRQNH